MNHPANQAMGVNSINTYTLIRFFYQCSLCALVLLVVACSSSDDPQPIQRSANGISGVVTDERGNVYTDASVNLTQGGNFIRRSNTDVDGEFQFSNLSFGDYELTLLLPKTTIDDGANPQTVLLQDSDGVTKDFQIATQPISGVVVLGNDDLLGEVKTVAGTVPADPEDLLYAVNVFSDQALVPILAPDMHHIKLSEWQTALGTVTMSCVSDSTRFEFAFTGLIPEGIYTLWLSPMNQTDILGTGALGLRDGSQNNLQVDVNGNGSINITMASGALSVNGDLLTCALTGTDTIVLILDYHIDGKTYGPVAGPDHTEVGHMLFTF